jgi:two-component system, NarL family, sensor histidine kinase BarA
MNSRVVKLPRHISFKKQLLNIFGMSIFLLVVFTSVITGWKTSQVLRVNAIETGQQLANNFSEQVVLALLTESEENAQEALDRVLSFQSVVGVAIYKNNKEALISSLEISDNIANAAIEKLLINVLALFETSDEWIFSAPVIFKEEGYDEELVDPDEEATSQQTLGYVFVKYDKSSLQQIQQSIFINNFVIASFVALLLLLVIRVVINRMTKPLLSLSQTMETVGNTGIHSKANVTGAKEVRKIAQAYNQMMTILEQQSRALEASRDTLESEVEVRTQELVVARDSAMTASRHKSEFLANISHELRTPLQAIIGYTDLVREDLELECMDAQADDLGKSIRSAHNLLALINNILDIAKIEAGRMDLYLKPVNIKNLVDETIETILPMAKANKNELIVSIGEISSTLLVDRQKLMQVFLNLLSNACKFTRDGTITFEIHNDKEDLYFSVKDTGVGIAQNKLDFIFEQFTQVDGSQTRQFEGTGLGMAITQNFCHLMGGVLTVESELNVGSIFKVRLPLNEG